MTRKNVFNVTIGKKLELYTSPRKCCQFQIRHAAVRGLEFSTFIGVAVAKVFGQDVNFNFLLWIMEM